ncbi:MULTISPECIES: Smr/MutS family protein [Nitrosomonas]|uniref:DNA-nicking Smr family endonuclease n=2 Tax=Nitrosomonas communis TaxID=44574 RepID=A0A5D3YB95_9PROT|nr:MULTISPECIES: Smr/MutS family protein [Nitrosomonas]TYP87292.1 DNA-nicking Smr family endonuclease [Nitrosomonas communis]UVS63031.1 Smr/MutS family protein [Nitrosomonas sp. PLL12]
MKPDKKGLTSDQTINEEEAALFREAMRDVIPLTPSRQVVHRPKPPRPIPRPAVQTATTAASQDTLSDHVSLEIPDGDEWAYLRPGLPRQTLRRLRRGHWKIQAELDMHGMTQNQARYALVAFLDECSRYGARCVCVIHGRGLGSKNHEPVLKLKVGNWLAQRHDVLAFCQATPEYGGRGAVLVLLKSTV